jgi:hypothetical protein
MNPVEQFLRGFFEERERKAGETYGDSFGSGPPEGIESVTYFADFAVATTRTDLGGKAYSRHRYRLRSAGDTWSIYQVSYQCGRCRGSGKKLDSGEDCVRCLGAGWVLDRWCRLS